MKAKDRGYKLMKCKSCKLEYRIGCLYGLCINCIQKYGHKFLHKALCSHLNKKKIFNFDKKDEGMI